MMFNILSSYTFQVSKLSNDSNSKTLSAMTSDVPWPEPLKTKKSK